MLALQALEQAAKEQGGSYTNRHRHQADGRILTQNNVGELVAGIVGVIQQNIRDEEALERIGKGIEQVAEKLGGGLPGAQGRNLTADTVILSQAIKITPS